MNYEVLSWKASSQPENLTPLAAWTHKHPLGSFRRQQLIHTIDELQFRQAS
jgi:hypothetical protein